MHHISTRLPACLHLAQARTVVHLQNSSLGSCKTADVPYYTIHSQMTQTQKEVMLLEFLMAWLECECVNERRGSLSPHPLLLFQPIINKHDKYLVCRFSEMHLCKHRRAASGQGWAALGRSSGERSSCFLSQLLRYIFPPFKKKKKKRTKNKWLLVC